MSLKTTELNTSMMGKLFLCIQVWLVSWFVFYFYFDMVRVGFKLQIFLVTLKVLLWLLFCQWKEFSFQSMNIDNSFEVVTIFIGIFNWSSCLFNQWILVIDLKSLCLTILISKTILKLYIYISAWLTALVENKQLLTRQHHDVHTHNHPEKHPCI